MIGTLAAWGMIQCFKRLRHHTVIRADYENDDIRDFGATGTHTSERRDRACR